MAYFLYKAKSGSQKVVSSVISAETDQDAIAKILLLGQTPIEIKPQETKASILEIKSDSDSNEFKVSLNDIAIFTRQLSDMIDAGVPLLKSLEVLIRQNQKGSIGELIISIHSFIKEGGSLSSALTQQSQVFSPLYVHMVKSGELGGFLPQVLNRLANYFEKELQMRSQIQKSLLYPMMVFAVGVLTIFVLFSFVLPRLTVMFDDFNTALPLPTQIVIAISAFFSTLWWLILLSIGGLIYYLRGWIKTAKGRLYIDTALLGIPIIKDFVINLEIARFARTLGTLMENGVSISLALDSVSNVIHNVVIRNMIQDVTTKVKEGKSLSVALKSHNTFPEMAIHLISVGEESGQSAKSLYKLAEVYERLVSQTAESFITLLGPMVLVVIVAIVGFIIISMLLPMFKMDMIVS